MKHILLAFTCIILLASVTSGCGKKKEKESDGELLSSIKEKAKNFNNSSNQSASTTCATDAKVCSDGSSVTRTGSNCEFAKCPGE